MENGAPGASEVVATIAGYSVGPEDVNVIISCLTITIVLGFIALFGMRKVKMVPSGTQALFEHVYSWMEGMSVSLMGPIGRRYTPFCTAIFLYILISNWIGLIPNVFEWIPPLRMLVPILEPPTKSANVTLAMAIISFVAFLAIGIHRNIERASGGGHDAHEPGHDAGVSHDAAHHGGGGGPIGGLVNWIAHYIQPVPTLWNSLEGAMKYGLVPLLLFLFIFLNIVEEVARILSLTFRLFGNIFGEHQVKTQFLGLVGLFGGQALTSFTSGAIGAGMGMGLMSVIMWASLLFVLCLGTLAGFIQAFVFALLTMSYIAHAVADHH